MKSKIHQAKLAIDTAAIGASRGDIQDRTDAYLMANAVTTPLALVGDLFAEEAGRDAQLSYEQQMAKARARFNDRMNFLQEQYTRYTITHQRI